MNSCQNIELHTQYRTCMLTHIQTDTQITTQHNTTRSTNTPHTRNSSAHLSRRFQKIRDSEVTLRIGPWWPHGAVKFGGGR